METNVSQTGVSQETRLRMVEFFAAAERAAALRVKEVANGTDAEERMIARRRWIEPAMSLLYWSEDVAVRRFLCRNLRVALQCELDHIASVLSYDKMMNSRKSLREGRIPYGAWHQSSEEYRKHLQTVEAVAADIN